MSGRTIMLVKVDFPYGTAEKFKAMSDEQYATLRSEFPEIGLSETRPEYHVSGFLTTSDEAARLIDLLGFDVTIKKVKGLLYGGEQDWRAIPSPSAQNIHISVPNNALYQVHTVKVLENSCTDTLQDYLTDGWRIIAVVPANDQRRPDYILGKGVA